MSHKNNQWYSIDNIQELDSPALVIFPERVKANIQTAISMVGDIERLRPHVKTNKSANAMQLMIEAGIRKYKCATIAEAEILGQCKAKDVLLAYQPLGPKLNRFIQLIKKYPDTVYSCLIDNLDSAKEQSLAFLEYELTVPVYIDLNIGMNRTGIDANEEAITLYQEASQLKGTQVIGLHAYDGHCRNPDIAKRTEECNTAFALVEKLRNKLIQSGFPAPKIIAGGSPTFPIHAQRKEVECSPGTFIYWDKGYSDICPEQGFLPAALVISRVISLPSKTRICTDLGHKSIASENELGKRVFFPDAEDVKPVGQSEEHLIIETNEDHTYKPGDVLYGIPYHVCPTVALYERAYTIENGKISGEWENKARDRKIGI